MDTTCLTDRELIDHTLKFDLDPVRLRLASVMDNTQGHLLDGLEFAGMDRETWLFENTWDPGQYVSHLENEIEYLNRELVEVREELHRLKARTVLDLMAELQSQTKKLEWQLEQSNKDRYEAVKQRDLAREQLKAWNHLRTP